MSGLEYSEQAFFETWKCLHAVRSNENLRVGEYVVMDAWEAPLMKEYARLLGEPRGDVLEIGFGMGLSATYIQARGVASHTIIEPHPQLFKTAESWAAQHDSKIVLIHDIWQNQVNRLPSFDAILFDPVHAPGRQDHDREMFVKIAATHLLRPGGRLILWHKGDSFPEAYQRIILRHFSQLQISLVTCGPPPENLAKKGYPIKMVVPVAIL